MGSTQIPPYGRNDGFVWGMENVRGKKRCFFPLTFYSINRSSFRSRTKQGKESFV